MASTTDGGAPVGSPAASSGGSDDGLHTAPQEPIKRDAQFLFVAAMAAHDISNIQTLAADPDVDPSATAILPDVALPPELWPAGEAVTGFIAAMITFTHEDSVDIGVYASTGCDPDWRGPAGDAAVHIAAAHGMVEPIPLLALAGADLSAPNGAGLVPLHLALASLNGDVVHALLLHGALPGAGIDANGRTPAQVGSAMGIGHLFDDWTLSADADRPRDLLIAAVRGDTAALGLALAAGVDPDKTLFAPVDYDYADRNALFAAIMNGRKEAVNALLDAGAGVDGDPSDPASAALIPAVTTHQADVVRRLLDAGADLANDDLGEGLVEFCGQISFPAGARLIAEALAGP